MIDNTEFSISKMTLDDFEEIKDTLISDFDDFWNPETLKNELENENSFYLVAKQNDIIVGFVGIKSVLDEADIMNIVTRKDFRNKGIGTAILSYIIDFALFNNIKKITLEVNENNISAIHLYEKLGFAKIAERPKYYNGIDTAIIMQLCFN
ncbi:MAG: ribosomal protein S18-alanine N-acetyltransferase [Clostridia bacterium]|nr:ribosomal protein S18-alanine N-acetyltransferase [Clostridia bacterium]